MDNTNQTMNKKIVVITIIVVIALVLVATLLNANKTKTVGQDTNQVTPTVQNPTSQPSGSAPLGNASATPVVSPATVSSNQEVAASLGSLPGSSEAPKQELVTSTEKIPSAAIKLSVSDTGFSPDTFTIKAGQEVSLALTATGSSTHVFIFPNASLMGLQIMVSAGETKVLTFTAPNAGSYPFRDDIPSFRQNTGTMIVK